MGFSSAFKKAALSVAFTTASFISNAEAQLPLKALPENAVRTQLPYNSPTVHIPYAIPFVSILKNGQVDRCNVDWGKDDAFMGTYRTLLTNLANRIPDTPELQTLLSKEIWTKKDRQNWEKNLLLLVATEIEKIPGLDKYRNHRIPNKDGEYASFQSLSLNNVSHDIEQKTYKYEFDCRGQSVIKGCLMQTLENRYLRDGTNEYKRPLAYYYITARSNHEKSPNEIQYHAFILSPLGAVIEGTLASTQPISHQYIMPLDPHYNLQSFLEGVPVAFSTVVTYGSKITADSANNARKQRMEEGIALAHNQMSNVTRMTQTYLEDGQIDAQEENNLVQLFDDARSTCIDVYTIISFSTKEFQILGYETMRKDFLSLPDPLMTLKRPDGQTCGDFHATWIKFLDKWKETLDKDLLPEINQIAEASHVSPQ